jgi:hypothetical protein
MVINVGKDYEDYVVEESVDGGWDIFKKGTNNMIATMYKHEDGTYQLSTYYNDISHQDAVVEIYILYQQSR